VRSLILLLISLCTAHCSLAQGSESLSPSSVVIFNGVVLREVPNKKAGSVDIDVLVRIDGDPRKEPNIGFLHDGDTVLVTIGNGQGPALHTGSRATFFGKDIDFGDFIHIYELGHRLLDSENIDRRGGEDNKATSQVNTELLAKVKLAQAVFGGVVTKVSAAKNIDVGYNSGLSSLSSPDKPVRITEHDPHWLNAEIKVVEPVKGDQKAYIVRFPASRDYLWSRIPKFSVGQKGTFILQSINKQDGSLVSLPSGEPIYKVDSSTEVLDAAAAKLIKSLMQGQEP
jgi:hypothetical protein